MITDKKKEFIITPSGTEEGAPSSQDPNTRETWAHPCEFFLSCLGYAVGYGNIWRFPYLCFKNGGAAFLIPYVIILVIAGIPMFFLELALGQYVSLSPAVLFPEIAPIFTGLGWAMLATVSMIAIFYNVIFAWTLFYTFASFQSVLPWSNCNNDFNSINCYSFEGVAECRNMSMYYYNRTCFSIEDYCGLSNLYQYNETHCSDDPNEQNGTGILSAEDAVSLISSSEDYYRNRMLGVTGTSWENMGGLNWELVGCLALSWILVALCMIKGIRSSGKVIYFFATFPYFVLVIFLVRGLTLEGAYEGIQFYILQPNITKLTEIQVWNDAATQIFYSLGIAYGSLITLSSYNNLKNNCMRDAITISISNCATSIFAGFVIFSVLGFMANQINVPVKDVVDSGSGLAFVAYPAAIARMPYPAVWSVLFFTMLICIGVDSQFTFVETLAAGLFDSVESLRPKKPLVMVCICFVLFLLGLPFCLHGGIYLFEVINTYAAGISTLLIAIIEVVCIAYVYGYRKFMNNITKEMEVPVHQYFKDYWSITWQFFTPASLIVIFALGIYYFQPVGWGSYVFPREVQILGWFMTIGSFAPIPICAIYVCYKSGKIGKELITSTDQFCPAQVRFKRRNQSKEEFKYTYDNDGYSPDNVIIHPMSSNGFDSHVNDIDGMESTSIHSDSDVQIPHEYSNASSNSSSPTITRGTRRFLNYDNYSTDLIIPEIKITDDSVVEKFDDIENCEDGSKQNTDINQGNDNKNYIDLTLINSTTVSENDTKIESSVDKSKDFSSCSELNFLDEIVKEIAINDKEKYFELKTEDKDNCNENNSHDFLQENKNNKEDKILEHNYHEKNLSSIDRNLGTNSSSEVVNFNSSLECNKNCDDISNSVELSNTSKGDSSDYDKINIDDIATSSVDNACSSDCNKIILDDNSINRKEFMFNNSLDNVKTIIDSNLKTNNQKIENSLDESSNTSNEVYNNSFDGKEINMGNNLKENDNNVDSSLDRNNLIDDSIISDRERDNLSENNNTVSEGTSMERRNVNTCLEYIKTIIDDASKYNIQDNDYTNDKNIIYNPENSNSRVSDNSEFTLVNPSCSEKETINNANSKSNIQSEEFSLNDNLNINIGSIDDSEERNKIIIDNDSITKKENDDSFDDDLKFKNEGIDTFTRNNKIIIEEGTIKVNDDSSDDDLNINIHDVDNSMKNDKIIIENESRTIRDNYDSSDDDSNIKKKVIDNSIENKNIIIKNDSRTRKENENSFDDNSKINNEDIDNSLGNNKIIIDIDLRASKENVDSSDDISKINVQDIDNSLESNKVTVEYDSKTDKKENYSTEVNTLIDNSLTTNNQGIDYRSNDNSTDNKEESDNISKSNSQVTESTLETSNITLNDQDISTSSDQRNTMDENLKFIKSQYY